MEKLFKFGSIWHTETAQLRRVPPPLIDHSRKKVTGNEYQVKGGGPFSDHESGLKKQSCAM